MFPSGTRSKVKITFPDKLWLGELSRKYPLFQFEVKSFIPISQDPFIGNSWITIHGINPVQILFFLKIHSSLKSYFVLEEATDHITINTQTNDALLLRSIINNNILIQFPIWIEKGEAEFELLSRSRENIDVFIEELQFHGINIILKTIGTYKDEINSHQLTSRQRDMYQKAKKAGYYESPRKITISELAQKENISKSTLSTLLQRIHKKLLGN